MVIDCQVICQLTDPLASRPVRLSVSENCSWITIEQAWALFRGQYILGKPLTLYAYRGGQATDFLWSAMVALFCVSGRVLELLDKNGVTGWATYPVEVFGRKGESLPDYYGFSITGGECKRDRSRSKIITKPAPTPTGMSFQVYKGLYFDETEWDGRDFFLIQKNIIAVTERVHSLFKKNAISNVRLIQLNAVEIDVYLDRFDNGI